MFPERSQNASHEAKGLHRLSYFIFTAFLGGRENYYSQFLNWQWRLRAVKPLARGHTARKQRRQDLDVDNRILVPYSEFPGNWDLLTTSSWLGNSTRIRM